MSNNFIGIGKCSRFYLYIIGYLLSSLFQKFLINIEDKKNGKGLLFFSPILNDHKLIQYLYKYFSFIIFGFFSFYITQKNTKKETISEIKKTNTKNRELIYNDIFKISKKDMALFFIISLIYIIVPLSISIIRYFGFDELILWTADIVFIVLLMNHYFPKPSYKHQKYSIIFVVIIDSIILISITFIKNSNDNKNIYMKKNIYICIIIIFLYIMLSFSFSFARINIKILYEFKYLSPYKIIGFLGIIGFILIFILSIIFSNLFNKENCKDDNLYFFCYDKISNYFINLNKRKNGNNKNYFYLEILIITPLYIFLNFISFTCEIFTIIYFNPNYIILSENLHYGILRIISFCINSNKRSIVKFILLGLADIMEFLGCIIYLEIY